MTDWKLIKRAMNCDAVKLTLPNWTPNWTNAYIFFDGENWKNESNCNISCFSLHSDWIEYKEPKKKIKKYLWVYASADGNEHKIAFNGEMFSVERLNEDILIKNNKKKNYFKIDNTMIEVDE